MDGMAMMIAVAEATRGHVMLAGVLVAIALLAGSLVGGKWGVGVVIVISAVATMLIRIWF